MEFLGAMRRWRVERLTARGYDSIDSGAFDRALRIAAELRARRYTSAFEIEALAHAGMGDVERAIAVLEEGVRIAPSAWLNWQLLGNYRSDRLRYEEADEAYRHALACPDAWATSIHLNRAILAARQGDHVRALEHLDDAGELEPGMLARAVGIRMEAARRLGDLPEAERIGAAFLRADPHASDLRLWGSRAAEVALLRLELGHDERSVAAFVAHSRRVAPDSSELLELASRLAVHENVGAGLVVRSGGESPMPSSVWTRIVATVRAWIVGRTFVRPTPPLRDHWVDVHVLFHAPLPCDDSDEVVVGYYRCLGLRCEPSRLEAMIAEQSPDGEVVWADCRWRVIDINRLPRSTRRRIEPSDRECAWFETGRAMYVGDPSSPSDEAR